MPANKGRKPPYERIDLRFRNGMVIRDTPSVWYRWKEWPEGPHAFDVVEWQRTDALKEWKGKQ